MIFHENDPFFPTGHLRLSLILDSQGMLQSQLATTQQPHLPKESIHCFQGRLHQAIRRLQIFHLWRRYKFWDMLFLQWYLMVFS
jgi:hypothetical protein